MISFGGIVVSIVATIGNWQTNKFDSLTPSTQLTFPFKNKFAHFSDEFYIIPPTLIHDQMLFWM
jgi:hypothetical protein